MISPSDFLTRSGVLYDSMRKRFQPRYWKSGKRAGRIREAGRELPFTKDEFRSWLMSEIGYRARPCPWCGVPVDILSLCIDHDVPVNRGGDLSLNNLVLCCSTCNRTKGELTSDEFQRLASFLRSLHPGAQNDVTRRLRAGAMGMRLRFYPRSKSPAPSQPQQSNMEAF